MNKRQPGQPIRVLIVEDSRTQREMLVGLLQASGLFQVVGTASTGKEAVEETLRLRPDIVAMDIHLPVFDGYEATRQIMQSCPTPIVMVSNSSGDADRRSLEAQTVGALAVVRKPGSMLYRDHGNERETLLRMLRLMADVPVVTRHRARVHPPQVPTSGTSQAGEQTYPRVLAIASSTGGPAAVQVILQGLGADFPLPILLAQHIAHGFVTALAEWLHNTTPLQVKVACPNEPMLPGHVYLPPDEQHILVREVGVVTLRPPGDGDRYCPSGDRLFAAVAAVYEARALGVILTGMGNDGAEGLRALRSRGAYTLAQDEATCVVYGMPQAAVALGAASRVEPLDNLAPVILRRVEQGRRQA